MCNTLLALNNDTNTDHNEERKNLNKHAQTFDRIACKYVHECNAVDVLLRDGGDSQSRASDSR